MVNLYHREIDKGARDAAEHVPDEKGRTYSESATSLHTENRAKPPGSFCFEKGVKSLVYTANWDKIAQLILKDQQVQGQVKIIYIKDGKVHVEI